MLDVYVRDGQTMRRRLIRLRSAHLQHLSSTGGYLILVPLACWFWLVAVVLTYPLQTFQEKRETSLTRPEASHARRGCCFPALQQQLSEWMQTRPLHSAPSFHIITIFFLMENVLRPPLTLSPTGNRAHTHAHKLLYKTFGSVVWTMLQKKNLLQLQTACLSFCHSAPHICMKTIHR